MEISNHESKLIDIHKDNFKSEVLESNIPVLLEFGASWCGPCHIIAPGIAQLAVEYENRMKFCFLDIDKDSEIKDECGVQDLPSIVLFKMGKMEDIIVGTKPTLEIKSRIEKLLKANK